MSRAIFFVLFAVLAGGCQPKRIPTPTRSTASTTTAPADAEFASERYGVRLSYPAGWTPRIVEAYEIVVAPGGNGGSAEATISLEVPKLPPHLPGFIPVGLVASGYVDDMRRQHAGVEMDDPVATKVAGATARRVRSMWPEADGSRRVEDAVLAVHGDRVYIFRAAADEASYPQVRDAFDDVLRSVRW